MSGAHKSSDFRTRATYQRLAVKHIAMLLSYGFENAREGFFALYEPEVRKLNRCVDALGFESPVFSRWLRYSGHDKTIIVEVTAHWPDKVETLNSPLMVERWSAKISPESIDSKKQFVLLREWAWNRNEDMPRRIDLPNASVETKVIVERLLTRASPSSYFYFVAKRLGSWLESISRLKPTAQAYRPHRTSRDTPVFVRDGSTIETPATLDTAHVAILLGVSTDTVLAWINSSELSALNLAADKSTRPIWRVERESLQAFLARRRKSVLPESIPYANKRTDKSLVNKWFPEN